MFSLCLLTGSLAQVKGVEVGDSIITVNGESVIGHSQKEVEEEIKKGKVNLI